MRHLTITTLINGIVYPPGTPEPDLLDITEGELTSLVSCGYLVGLPQTDDIPLPAESSSDDPPASATGPDAGDPVDPVGDAALATDPTAPADLSVDESQEATETVASGAELAAHASAPASAGEGDVDSFAAVAVQVFAKSNASGDSDIVTLPDATITALIDGGILTVGDAIAHKDANGGFDKIRGIGPPTSKRIIAALDAFLASAH